jgi:hypothetical protein
VGCVNTGFPNLGICRLIALIDAINAQDPALLGGARVQRRLLRKANRALRAGQRMYLGTPRIRDLNLRRATRALEGIERLIQRGLIRGTFDPTVGDLLLDLAADAARALAGSL